MKKSSWRDRFEFALQAAVERSAGVRELATRGLEEGAKQLGAWQERQRQAEVFAELGRAVWRLARDGRLLDLEQDPTIVHLLDRIEQGGAGQAEAGGDQAADRFDFSEALARTGYGSSLADEDDGTVSAASSVGVGGGAGHRSPPRTSWGAPVTKFDALGEPEDGEAEDLAAYMHKDDLDR